MERYRSLATYKSNENKNAKYLEVVTKEFKEKITEFISESFVEDSINDEITKKTIIKNIKKIVKEEYNTLEIPYFYILENINLCVEVEMSKNLMIQESSKKFAETKFSDILNGGVQKFEPIKRFAISEKKFLEKLVDFIEKFTESYKITDETIKIEFV